MHVLLSKLNIGCERFYLYCLFTIDWIKPEIVTGQYNSRAGISNVILPGGCGKWSQNRKNSERYWISNIKRNLVLKYNIYIYIYYIAARYIYIFLIIFQFLSTMPKKSEDKLVIVSCPEDKLLCSHASMTGVPVVNPEFILTGILRQEISIKSYPFCCNIYNIIKSSH